MKSFEEFKELLVDTFEGFEVEFNRIEKLNYSYNGVTIRKAGENFGATCDVDVIYRDYLNNEDALVNFYDFINRNLESSEEANAIRAFVNDTSVLYDVSNYRVRICSVSGKEQYLEDKIWRPFLDLAIVVYANLYEDNNGSGSVIVTKDIAQNTGLSEDEIIDAAIKNSMSYEPPFYSSLFDVIKDASPEYEDLPDPGNPIYVVSNKRKTNGAYAMLDTEGVLKSVAELLGNEYYILPSSVHELLCLPKDDNEAQEHFLFEMVSEVNSSCVSEQEFLSNSIYKYNNGVVELVNVKVC